MVTKNAKSSKSSSTTQKEKVLTVSEYAKEFDVTENSVRTKLKNGELELTHIERKGKKIQAVKVNAKEAAPAKTPTAPKLVKVSSLKTTDYKELIKDKDGEIKFLNKELNKKEDKLDKLEKEVKRLNEIIKSKSELISSHEKLLKSRESEIHDLKKIHSENQTAAKKKSTVSPPKDEKKPGFFASLFGNNKKK